MTARVLLLEDDPSIRSLLTEVLVDDGHDVQPCESVHEVRTAAIRDGAPCLAVVDPWGESQAYLTDADRAEILSLSSTVPTIMLTGRTWAQGMGADELGLLALVAKPFDIFAVSALVNRSLETIVRESNAISAQSQRLREHSDQARERLSIARQHLIPSLQPNHPKAWDDRGSTQDAPNR